MHTNSMHNNHDHAGLRMMRSNNENYTWLNQFEFLFKIVRSSLCARLNSKKMRYYDTDHIEFIVCDGLRISG